MRFGILLVLVGVAAADDVWQPLRDAIDKFGLLKNVVVSAGNASGQVFLHEKGTTKFDTDMPIASASKWLAGVTVMKGVQDGHLSLDDLASKHLDYWTKDSSDPRSRITLKHFMSFHDGYTDFLGGSTSCPENQFMTCVKHIYDNTKHSGTEPGLHFAYNELHLQFAMAMLVSATGRTSPTAHVDLVDEAVFKPAGMKNTHYSNPSNPDFSSSIVTRASDYEKFLHAYTTLQLVSKDMYELMGQNNYPNSTFPFPANIIGHYGLANWYECFMHMGKWRDACTDQHLMSSEGAEGYYPLDARKEKYYFQIATTGGPAQSAVLKEQIKPLLDAVIAGQSVPPLKFTAEECKEAVEQLEEPMRVLFGKSKRVVVV